MSGYAVNLHEHGKPVGLLAKRCARVRAHTHGHMGHVDTCGSMQSKPCVMTHRPP